MTNEEMFAEYGCTDAYGRRIENDHVMVLPPKPHLKLGADGIPTSFQCQRCDTKVCADIGTLKATIQSCKVRNAIRNQAVFRECGLVELVSFAEKLKKDISPTKQLPVLLQSRSCVACGGTGRASNGRLCQPCVRAGRAGEVLHEPEVLEREIGFEVDDPICIVISKKGHVTIVSAQ